MFIGFICLKPEQLFGNKIIQGLLWMMIFLHPMPMKLRGYTVFTLSLRLSVRRPICNSFCTLVCLSIYKQNHVYSLSSTKLARSISFLCMLSINFRRCVILTFWTKFQNLNFCKNVQLHDLAYHVLASSGCRNMLIFMHIFNPQEFFGQFWHENNHKGEYVSGITLFTVPHWICA